jgi:uncharacterized membrane protein (UPF0127 family)
MILNRLPDLPTCFRYYGVALLTLGCLAIPVSMHSETHSATKAIEQPLSASYITAASPKSPAGMPEALVSIAGKTYRIEVATTPQQAEKGLMYRTSLPPGHGMLFPFQPARPVAFWMKNTKIPLDMLFLADGHVLHVFEKVQPCLSEPCPTYSLPVPVDMVLELPDGTAERDHLKTGDASKLSAVTHHAITQHKVPTHLRKGR